ncbi:hydantoinase/carbamoylase family amidase [Rhizobium sp. LCM 4573]|uniref:hydantoinase/carbamoylase family amidase n=1 Tax=Rhizobium sp. LCM 4573 TaxID=1848291 RepID=UPI0008DAF71B|nr:hydantoinase/carbamoylase family amidase [Rhizobium sp. LCM 4573]OHV82804.1 Zn-dependent hydrolase [Rhizobium sp. LCM 4573]
MSVALPKTIETYDLAGEAARLFAEIAAHTADAEGVSRPAFSAIETKTLEFLIDYAHSEGLVAEWDAGRNVVFSLPEHQTAERYVLVGSHVDSVPRGGNFDGLAGVLSGLVCLVRARRQAIHFPQPVKVIAMRGEESAWFGPCYIGSKALLGALSADELAAKHRADGRSLDAHMEAIGIDMVPIRAGKPLLDGASVSAYLEVHIEQGPVLVERQLPAAIVSGIRGNFRYKKIACHGEAGHSGAVPLAYRHDPVLAMVELLNVLDAAWHDFVAKGRDLVVTSGMVSTDQQKHALSRIPDSVEFSLDIRSQDSEMLASMHALVLSNVARIERERAVRFDLGTALWTSPAPCDETLIGMLGEASQAVGNPFTQIPSGGGHDAAVFSKAGIPSAMIFIRNRNGSHNPDEAMEITDFGIATDILYHFLADFAEASVRAKPSHQTGKANVSMFSRITDIIRAKGNGARAYQAAAAAARQAALAEPQRAAGYFILAAAAQEFGDVHYGEASHGDIFGLELKRFDAYVKLLDEAFEDIDVERQLKAVSTIAASLISNKMADRQP